MEERRKNKEKKRDSELEIGRDRNRHEGLRPGRYDTELPPLSL